MEKKKVNFIHNVFEDQIFKSPAVTPARPGVNDGVEGVKKAESMPLTTVTTVKVKGA